MAKYGDFGIEVASTVGLQVNQSIEIIEKDIEDKSLAINLYHGDAGDISQLATTTFTSMVVSIKEIGGKRVVFNRPLRFDIDTKWNPIVKSYNPTVEGCGVEDFAIDFPNTPYMGHFTVLGFNPLVFGAVQNCWAKNIRVKKAESGPFVDGEFCSIDSIIIESVRKPDSSGCTGHYGISAIGEDNVITHFDMLTAYIHDLSVEHSAGNVFMNGKGINLSLDNHKRTPYSNCFTNIDLGLGLQVWHTGGGGGLGKHCATRGTFWNLKAAKPLPMPPSDFAADYVNMVGILIKA